MSIETPSTSVIAQVRQRRKKKETNGGGGYWNVLWSMKNFLECAFIMLCWWLYALEYLCINENNTVKLYTLHIYILFYSYYVSIKLLKLKKNMSNKKNVKNGKVRTRFCFWFKEPFDQIILPHCALLSMELTSCEVCIQGADSFKCSASISYAFC